jgi:DeoR/GlpR family transcriptional regulator of sugar metabolism
MVYLERHEQILNYLAQHERLSVEEAIHLFHASPATIRRDFHDLSQQKLTQRIRGGVRLEKDSADSMPPFSLREIRQSAEKDALGRQAATLLRPGDVVFVDGGTTTYHLGASLPDMPLCVITNSLRLAALLEEKRLDRTGLDLYITGGFLYPNSGGLLLGPNAQASLSQYHAHWAFLSAGGVTESGISNTNELVMDTERVMIGNAEKVVILADHSKLGKHALCHVCGLDRVDILITDEWPEHAPLLERIKEAGVQVLQVEKSAVPHF